MDGRITTMKRERGFGFLVGSDGVSRFFHANECIQPQYSQLHEGDDVTFEPHTEPGKGERAVKVCKR